MVGFLVDGVGDVVALQRRYGCRVVKAAGPRGHTVPPDEIARAARAQIFLLAATGCSSAVIVTDREQRPDSGEAFAEAIAAVLKDQPLPIPVAVAVPDRMLENWFLADTTELSKKRAYIKDKLSQQKYEGTHGKKELKNLFKPKYEYSETKHGPQLFCTIRSAVACKNSSSFRAFAAILTGEGLGS